MPNVFRIGPVLCVQTDRGSKWHPVVDVRDRHTPCGIFLPGPASVVTKALDLIDSADRCGTPACMTTRQRLQGAV